MDKQYVIVLDDEFGGHVVGPFDYYSAAHYYKEMICVGKIRPFVNPINWDKPQAVSEMPSATVVTDFAMESVDESCIHCLSKICKGDCKEAQSFQEDDGLDRY